MMAVDVRRKAFGLSKILGEIQFSVSETEAVALTGPSGIGKSTLLRIIAGLDQSFDGKISGVGRLGFVFQEPTLLPWRTAIDNIILASCVSSIDAEALLSKVGLADKSDFFPSQLSLGQRRRVAIVRAFARQPQTLLMDEPFASLDQQAAFEMRALLKDLLDSAPTRLILVTHDHADALDIADRIIRLAGSPAVIADQSDVRN